MDENREIYNTHPSYTHKSLWTQPTTAYDKKMIEIRRSMLSRFAANRDVLDLCCGSGVYLIPILDKVKSAVGIDFSSNMLNGFREELRNVKTPNPVLIEADATSLPLSDACFDFVFSFTALYYVPRVELAIKEVARVLRPSGYAVLELGNLYNINTLITAGFHKQLGWAKTYHISYYKMWKYLRAASLEPVEWHCFQLSPMYGAPRKYIWLYPITHPAWKKLMGIEIRGKMLDEWISSAFPLRYIASRHLIVTRKK
jgi:ubiquinone/menaquinone biosynthesis C-methylase UbiE